MGGRNIKRYWRVYEEMLARWMGETSRGTGGYIKKYWLDGSEGCQELLAVYTGGAGSGNIKKY